MRIESTTKNKDLSGVQFSTVRIPIFNKKHSYNAQTVDAVVLNESQNLMEVTTDVYEGGLKIWECSIDLCSMLLDENFVSTVKDQVVFEMGCGQGLPGIIAASLGARKVVFQDLNQHVLKDATEKNILQNLSDEQISKCDLVDAEWGAYAAAQQVPEFDIILSAETLYRVEYYDVIIAFLKATLKVNGVAYFSSKGYYFGVGGGTYSFAQYLKQLGATYIDSDGDVEVNESLTGAKEFTLRIVKEYKDSRSNVREIISVTRHE